MQDGIIVKHHTWPRVSLLTLSNIRDSACDASSFGDQRLTIGTFTDGTPVKNEDCWKCEANAHMPMEKEWAGFTILRRGKQKPTRTQVGTAQARQYVLGMDPL